MRGPIVTYRGGGPVRSVSTFLLPSLAFQDAPGQDFYIHWAILSLWGIVWGIKMLIKKKGLKFFSNPLKLQMVVPTGFEPVLPT
jgi:hypothetical protein